MHDHNYIWGTLFLPFFRPDLPSSLFPALSFLLTFPSPSILLPFSFSFLCARVRARASCPFALGHRIGALRRETLCLEFRNSNLRGAGLRPARTGPCARRSHLHRTVQYSKHRIGITFVIRLFMSILPLAPISVIPYLSLYPAPLSYMTKHKTFAIWLRAR